MDAKIMTPWYAFTQWYFLLGQQWVFLIRNLDY